MVEAPERTRNRSVLTRSAGPGVQFLTGQTEFGEARMVPLIC
jgi:hypothetical protein